ncbi:hypothetical protein PAXRUDRAFT_180643 [Paxillus rubicundulus Ve08.2h10]|uniref:Uncharacterized protein n=1 Tax=Paxillus rubicundulus Ve08.2h10 TaxID=930991 RepID=A0A0D0CYG9_9AGAM|nr:hypothetical protein PAXRUDRAFT_180643 [Paxillus rubicundulus Ve08.2h10]
MSWPLSPSSESTPNDVVFTIALTVYSTIWKTTKNKTTAKEEKAVKMKELAFAVDGLDSTNYLNFLHAGLCKHNQDVFKITQAKCYPFKYIIGVKWKASDAMDVDNSGDYKEMVKKIDDEKPTTVKIFINMKVVEKLPFKTNIADEDEADSSGDNGLGSLASSALTKLDLRLACWHTMLEKKYQDNHLDNTFTYVGPLGALTLTPAMILDWSGQATLLMPQNIDSFDMAYKAPVLNPGRRAAQPPSVLDPIHSTPAVDLNTLTSVLLLQTSTRGGLVLPSSSEAQQPAPQPIPKTPTR